MTSTIWGVASTILGEGAFVFHDEQAPDAILWRFITIIFSRSQSWVF